MIYLGTARGSVLLLPDCREFKREKRPVSSGPACQIGAANFGDKVAHVKRAFLSWMLVIAGENEVCSKESIFHINMAWRRGQGGMVEGGK